MGRKEARAKSLKKKKIVKSIFGIAKTFGGKYSPFTEKDRMDYPEH